MKPMTSLLLGLSALSAAACSSSSSSPSTTATNASATVQGNVVGEAVPQAHAAASTILLPKNTPAVNETADDVTVLHVAVGTVDDFDGYCSLTAKKGAIGLTFDAGKKGDAFAAGSYAVAGTNAKLGPDLVEVHAQKFDATCAAPNGSSIDGASGTLNVETFDGKNVSGSFNVKLSNGDVVTGTFLSTPLCASPAIGARASCG